MTAPVCPSGLEVLERIGREARRRRVPITAGFELTRRCNLRCRHCYTRTDDGSAADLPTADVLRVLDELADAGCLFLLLTGGEPLVRDDFTTIYRHAVSRGIKVTLFTNGTLVTEELAAFLADWPPREVEITLYGATPETCARVTGSADALARTCRGIETLLARGLRVGLKSVLMTLNRHEFADIERLAGRYGVRFRMDAAVFPRLDGVRDPLAVRVEPEVAAAIELASPGRAEQWRSLRARAPEVPGSALYRCGAGITSCHVDAAGGLMPCLMMPAARYDLRKGRFADGWAGGAMRRHAGRGLRGDSPCRGCADAVFCGYCPAYFALETGDEHKPAEWMCQAGRARRRRLEPISPEECDDEGRHAQGSEGTAPLHQARAQTH